MSDLEEDELGALLTEDADDQIMETLAALRSEDPAIYDDSYWPTRGDKRTEEAQRKWVPQSEDREADDFLKQYFGDSQWRVSDDTFVHDLELGPVGDDDSDDIARQNQHEWDHNRKCAVVPTGAHRSAAADSSKLSRKHSRALVTAKEEEETKHTEGEQCDDSCETEDSSESELLRQFLEDSSDEESAKPRLHQAFAECAKLKKRISASKFWKDFVQKRRPAHLLKRAVPRDFRKLPFWSKWRSDAYLREKCGECAVRVEVRSGENFGVATKVLMSFGQFLDECTGDSAVDDDCDLYLSVQDIGAIQRGPFSGMPSAIASTPLSQLRSDFPLQMTESLIGSGVVTHQINAWMGHSLKGASSKLHFDFHDNFYCVVRGTKLLTLFPPSCQPFLYLNGADTDSLQISAKSVSKKLQMSGSTLFETMAEGMDAELDAAFQSGFDDFEELGIGEDVVVSMSDDTVGEFHSDGSGEDEAGDCLLFDGAEFQKDPPSFSRIDLSKSDEEIEAQFPDFAKVKHLRRRVEIRAGEMLFLPRGWFHEVTSVSEPQLSSHLALSYWFYPPETDQCSMEAPYKNDYFRKWFDSLIS